MNNQSVTPPQSKLRHKKPRAMGLVTLLFDKKDQQGLADQFLLTHRATLESIKAQNPQASTDLIKRIENLLDSAEGSWEEKWEIAYEVEQYFVILLDPTSLEVELKRRLIELKDKFEPEMAKVYEQEINGNLSEERKRAMLLRIVNDLQWRYTNQEERREYEQLVRMRTGTVFVLAMITFFVCLFAATRMQDQYIYAQLLASGGAGMWGATFSMLLGLRTQLKNSSLEDLKVVHRLGHILVRPLLGVGGALILVILLHSGLLSGEIFPVVPDKLVDKNGNLDVLPNKQFSLLVVWSYIAGFSEMFIPNILSKSSSSTQESRIVKKP